MPAEKTTAIVLRLVDFSETSCVVTFFTREFGKLGAMAKGARRLKGPFDSALDLLTLCRIVFRRKTSAQLDLLTEARLEHRFRPGGGDLARLYAAYYVAELLSSLTVEYDPHPELFDSADETLKTLACESPLPPAILRFELMALRLLGHLPSLDMCVECGRNVAAGPRVAFGQLAGGVLCANCKAGQRQVVSLSAGVLQTLSTFADASSDRWRNEEIEPNVRGELRGVLNHYISNLIGRKTRMHDYLRDLA